MKLSARTPIGSLLAATALVLGMLAVAPGFAQEGTHESNSEIWTSPTHAWMLQIDTSRWRHGGPPPGVTGDIVFGAISRDAAPAGETRVCQARENLSLPRADLDEAGVRDYAARIDIARAAPVFGANGDTVTAVTHTHVGNITVAEISTAGANGNGLFRVFAVPLSNGFAMVQLSSSWSHTISPEGRRAVEALLMSLTFQRERP